MPRPRKPASPFRYFNSSPEVIRLVVLMYVRFPLSLRNVEDLLFERGIDICHETVRLWWNRFGPLFVSDIHRQRVSRMRGFRQWRGHGFLKSFGCRQAYESLGSPNPRATGGALWDLRFPACWGAQQHGIRRRASECGPSGIGWAGWVHRRGSPVTVDVVSALAAVGTGDTVSASTGAAGYVALGPCRVTTRAFRILVHEPAVRGAGIGAPSNQMHRLVIG